MVEAYLDIETTGLSCRYCEITVVGVCLSDGRTNHFFQLVGTEVTKDNLLYSLEEAERIYTYNGSRFDLPFIHGSLGVNLASLIHHRDLMYDCWRCNLKGGFKAVERQLGIARQLQEVDGYEAVLLWQRYRKHNDRVALARLLEYNKEDVMNLLQLKQRLEGWFETGNYLSELWESKES